MDWEKLQTLLQTTDFRLDLMCHKNRWYATLKDKIFNEGMYFGMGDSADVAIETLLRVTPKELPTRESSNG